MPPSPFSTDALYQAEINRIARALFGLRAERAVWGFVPVLVLWLLDPTFPRALLLSMFGTLFYVSAVVEAKKAERQGVDLHNLARNARILATGHATMLLATGGLTSPLLPVLLLFPMAMTVVIGSDPSLNGYLAYQVGIILTMTVLQFLGWNRIFAPSWMEPTTSQSHALVAGLVLLLMLSFSVRIGKYIRVLFDDVLGRVAQTRGDLLESHRAQAEDLTALSGAIAHELKNPLASIKGLAGLLSRDLSGKSAERLGVLREEADRMQVILEEFLTFSRPLVPSVKEPVDLRFLSDGVAALHEGLLRNRNLRLVTAGTAKAEADIRKTRQILINLLQNAIEASPAGGTIWIVVSQENRHAEIRVEDEGAGPDEALGEGVFKAGVTTKASGNGLGLTIARGLARQQNGDLVLEKRPGGGALARLSLPEGE